MITWTARDSISCRVTEGDQHWVAFLQCTQFNCDALQVQTLGRQSQYGVERANQELLSFLLAFLSTFFCYQSVLTRERESKKRGGLRHLRGVQR